MVIEPGEKVDGVKKGGRRGFCEGAHMHRSFLTSLPLHPLAFANLWGLVRCSFSGLEVFLHFMLHARYLLRSRTRNPACARLAHTWWPLPALPERPQLQQHPAPPLATATPPWHLPPRPKLLRPSSTATSTGLSTTRSPALDAYRGPLQRSPCPHPPWPRRRRNRRAEATWTASPCWS